MFVPAVLFGQQRFVFDVPVDFRTDVLPDPGKWPKAH
jgi:hypothetical protein